MERVFYNLHSNIATSALRYTTHRSRSPVEHCTLIVAVSAFCVVLMCHHAFVYRGPNMTTKAGAAGGMLLQEFDPSGEQYSSWGGLIPTTCLRSVPGFTEDADVTHILLAEENKRRRRSDGIILESSNGGVKSKSFAYTLHDLDEIMKDESKTTRKQHGLRTFSRDSPRQTLPHKNITLHWPTYVGP